MARGFGGRQRLVGCVFQRLVVHAGPLHRQAGADGHGNSHRTVFAHFRFDGAANVPQDSSKDFPALFVENDGELPAAITGSGRIQTNHVVPQNLGYILQDPVANHMTVTVVAILEVVNLDECEAAHCRRGGFRNIRLQRFLEGRSIQHGRHLVDPGLALLPFEPFRFLRQLPFDLPQIRLELFVRFAKFGGGVRDDLTARLVGHGSQGERLLNSHHSARMLGHLVGKIGGDAMQLRNRQLSGRSIHLTSFKQGPIPLLGKPISQHAGRQGNCHRDGNGENE